MDDPETYPIQPKQHSMEFLREVAHLRPRTNLFGAITRVRHTMMTAIHRHLTDQGFFWVNTPIITTSRRRGRRRHVPRCPRWTWPTCRATTRGAIDFRKDFFGREAFLTVSGQLNVEAYCLAMSKVYTFGPTFRAENSNTPRHLAEFWMVRAGDRLRRPRRRCRLRRSLSQGHLQGRAGRTRRRHGVLRRARADRCDQPPGSIHRRAVRAHRLHRLPCGILQKSGQKFEYPVAWGVDLQTEHER